MVHRLFSGVALVVLLPLALASAALGEEERDMTVSEFLASCSASNLRATSPGPNDDCGQLLFGELIDPQACLNGVAYAVFAPAIVQWVRERPQLAPSAALDAVEAAARALYPCH